MKKRLLYLLSLLIFGNQCLFGAAMAPIAEEDENAVEGGGGGGAAVSAAPVAQPDLNYLYQLAQQSPVQKGFEGKGFLTAEKYRNRDLFKSIASDFNQTMNRFKFSMFCVLTDQHNGFPEGYFTGADFHPFMERKTVAPGARVITVGDLHGGLHTLVNILMQLQREDLIDNNFKILKPNVYLVFLGDYVDRGAYGVEVIYTLARLKLANPDQVVLLRGNHEDVGMNVSDPDSAEINFEDELELKFGHPAQRMLEFIDEQFYSKLPLALYLGNGQHWVQFCHGGIDPRYNPSAFLQNANAQKQYDCMVLNENWSEVLPVAVRPAIATIFLDLIRHGEKVERFFDPSANLMTCDFVWGDFAVDPDASALWCNFGSGRWIYGKKLVQPLMQAYGVAAMFRGHQHYGDMLDLLEQSKGVAVLGGAAPAASDVDQHALQQGMMVTMMLAQSSGFWDQAIDGDVFAELTVGAGALDSWRLTKRAAEYMPAEAAAKAAAVEVAAIAAAADDDLRAGGSTTGDVLPADDDDFVAVDVAFKGLQLSHARKLGDKGKGAAAAKAAADAEADAEVVGTMDGGADDNGAGAAGAGDAEAEAIVVTAGSGGGGGGAAT